MFLYCFTRCTARWAAHFEASWVNGNLSLRWLSGREKCIFLVFVEAKIGVIGDTNPQMCYCRHLTFHFNVVPVTIQQCYLNNYLSLSASHTPTHIKSTHPCNWRTKCPASVNEGFLMFQGPLGIYFSAPCFFLSSPLSGTAGGWFGFLWCVCVCVVRGREVVRCRGRGGKGK